MTRPYRTSSFLRVLPIKRWALLILAIFFLFSMFGFLIDMLDLAHKPLMIVLAWTLFTGLIAVVYLLVLTKAPRLLIAAIALHLVGSWLVNRLIHRYAFGLSHPSIDHSIHLDSIASLLLSLAACICFLLFIQTEGRRALQLQTELSLAHEIQRTLVPSIELRTEQYEIYGVSLPSEKVGGDLSEQVSVSPGDLLLMLTDGVLEVENSKGEDYGFGPVERALIERSAEPLQQIAESILKDLHAFGPQRDDQTLLLIRVL